MHIFSKNDICIELPAEFDHLLTPRNDPDAANSWFETQLKQHGIEKSETPEKYPEPFQTLWRYLHDERRTGLSWLPAEEA